MWWLSCIVSNVVLALLLALTAWLVQRRLRQYAVARIIWVLALVKLVTPPLAIVPIGSAFSTMACTLGVCGCEQHALAPAVVRDALPWMLLVVWSVGAVATGWTAWRRWIRFRRLTAHAIPPPPQWQMLAARLGSQLSLRRPPEILVAPGRLPPLVVPGWRRPRLLLPTGVMDRLNDAQRSTLLLHELVHLKRGDHWVRLLELVVGVAFWWLPVVGVIGRQLRACEEACCDAAVVAQLPHARRDYAQLLLDVVDFTCPLSSNAVPQATAMSAANDLERRLHAILDPTQVVRRTRPACTFAVCLACAILPCQLHYGFVGQRVADERPPSAATSPQGGSAEGAKPQPISDRESERFAVYCCPT